MTDIIPDKISVIPPTKRFRTRESKIDFIKGVATGQRSKDELKPKIHVTKFVERIEADTYRDCSNGKTFTKDEFDEHKRSIECTQLRIVMFVDMSGSKY